MASLTASRTGPTSGRRRGRRTGRWAPGSSGGRAGARSRRRDRRSSPPTCSWRGGTSRSGGRCRVGCCCSSRVTPPKTVALPSGPMTSIGYQRPYFMGAAAVKVSEAGSNRLARTSLAESIAGGQDRRLLPARRILPLGSAVRSAQNRSPALGTGRPARRWDRGRAARLPQALPTNRPRAAGHPGGADGSSSTCGPVRRWGWSGRPSGWERPTGACRTAGRGPGLAVAGRRREGSDPRAFSWLSSPLK